MNIVQIQNALINTSFTFEGKKYFFKNLTSYDEKIHVDISS